MAGLVNIKEIPSSLFDQLLILNDLVQTLKDTSNFNDLIAQLRTERDDVKKQYDDLAVLKSADDQTTKDLTAATAANNASIATLQAAQTNADQSKAASDSSANKAAQAQKALAQAQADFDAKAAAANADLADRERAVSLREAVATKAQNDADAMKYDYTTKLEALQKITGG